MPEGMPPRVMAYRFFAKMYHFTRRQVDEEIDIEDYEWFPRIEQAEARATAMKQRRAEREARAAQRRGL